MASELKTIRLHGVLGELFGEEFRLAVATPAEAVRALCCLRPGLQTYLMNSKDNGMEFAVYAGKRNLSLDEIRYPSGDDEIKFVPVIDGAKSGGGIMTILGAVLVVVGLVIGWTTPLGMMMIGMGGSLMLGGIITMLAPVPKDTEDKDKENNPSYAFNGPVNTQAQGNPVPVAYGGPMYVGSAVISASISAADGSYVPDVTANPTGTAGSDGGGSAPFHYEYMSAGTDVMMTGRTVRTLAAVTTTAAGTLAAFTNRTGTLASTLAVATVVSNGIRNYLPGTGSLARTLALVTSATVGKLALTSTAAYTLAPATAIITGGLSGTATLATTLANATIVGNAGAGALSWSIVGVSARVTSNTGDITLTEIAGTAQGDLVIAYIAYKDTAPFTVPAGWLKIAEEAFGDGLNPGTASGVMAYIVRGATAPSYDFTHASSTGGIGFTAAYRRAGSVTPLLDVSSSQTAATASTILSTESISPSVAGELLIAMGAVGASTLATIGNCDATDPGIASGALDTTTPPITGAWTRRATSQTAAGTGVAIGLFDAVKAGAGATGVVSAESDGAVTKGVMIVASFKQESPTLRTATLASTLAPATVSAAGDISGYVSATWSLVGVAAMTTVSSGNVTLAEPAGVAAGDLLIANIAYRSNAPFYNTDWTQIAVQNTGDTTTPAGIASAVMFYKIRGASAPTLQFSRTGGDLGRGNIVAYRSSGSTIPTLDASSSATLASAGLVVSTASITTANAGELIVVMTAAGMNANVDVPGYDATDPGTASGGIDTSTAPTAGTWIKRADSGTGTAADGGLAVGEAVRSTAGATGTIQAEIGGSARHAIIAAAFYTDAASGEPPAAGPFDSLYAAGWLPNNNTVVYTPPTLTIPAKSTGITDVSYTEANYGTKVFRVSQSSDSPSGGRMRHEYSRKQAFNCDSTKFVLFNGNGFGFLYDATTFVRANGGCPNSGGANQSIGNASTQLKNGRDWYWHPTDPNKIIWQHYDYGLIIYTMDITAPGTVSVYRNFTGRLNAFGTVATIGNGGEGVTSDDGRYWGFQVKDANAATLGYFTYDIVNDTILGTMITSVSSNNVTMSPSGDYIIPSSSAQGMTFAQCAAYGSLRGTRAYTRDFSSFKQVHNELLHATVGRDSFGNDVYISNKTNQNPGWPDLPSGRSIYYIRCSGSDGPVRLLDDSVTTQWHEHFSGVCSPDRPGWVVFSFYDSQVRGTRSYIDDVVMLAEIKPINTGGKRYRLMDHRTKRLDYWQEPHSTISPDGLRIMSALTPHNTLSTDLPFGYMIGLPSWIYD